MKRLRGQGAKNFRFDISSLEVYCENVRDLYGQDENGPLNLITTKNRVVIQGQTWRPVDSAQQFLEYIKLSASKRIFSNNGVNERSSRSHHIFQIKIHGQDNRYEPYESLLNIIDLAGSERRGSMVP